MLLALIIISILIVVNLILLKFSCNQPQRPNQKNLGKQVKIVRLQPHFKNSNNEINPFTGQVLKNRKVSNK